MLKSIYIFFTIALFLAFCCASLSGCQVLGPIYDEDNVSIKTTRQDVLTIFMDGTGNKPSKNPNKNSNAYRLYNLRNQNHRSYYIEGVGNNYKFLGLMSGLGTANRAKKVYRYLSVNYNGDESIYMFGFSRGAYGCRIVSDMVYTNGVLDLSKVTMSKGGTKILRKKITRKLYRKYERNSVEEARLKSVKMISNWNQKHSGKDTLEIDVTGSVRIKAMGLFETVEALGVPDYKEEFIYPNKRHFNQTYNISKIYHAMALDDNRARIYTPILFRTNNAHRDKKPELKEAEVDEVWFSGSHSDVGGSHRAFPEISYNSFNWMLSNFEEEAIFKKTPHENYPYSRIHNMQSFSMGMWLITRNRNRDIVVYYEMTGGGNAGKLKIHQTVIDRLAYGLLPEFKTDSKRNKGERAKGQVKPRRMKEVYDWYDLAPFKDCFEKQGKKRIYIGNDKCNCLKVVD
ncbi:MAG: DUF2235 domain-containing protein [Flavobacteriales bacterium]|nr:DUF2235 domain-containing protein [Flavobacteriales bacterium]